MKKAIGYIIGSIFTMSGLFMTLVSCMEKSTNSRYTWKQPFSKHELEVITTQWIGIAVLIIGAIMLLLLVFSSIYQQNNIKDTSNNSGFKLCPHCNCKITQNTQICPKCKNKLF